MRRYHEVPPNYALSDLFNPGIVASGKPCAEVSGILSFALY